jgi:hypothetical protein
LGSKPSTKQEEGYYMTGFLLGGNSSGVSRDFGLRTFCEAEQRFLLLFLEKEECSMTGFSNLLRFLLLFPEKEASGQQLVYSAKYNNGFRLVFQMTCGFN